ncbi:hypothetical protein [Rhodoplanes sp. SY1]
MNIEPPIIAPTIDVSMNPSAVHDGAKGGCLERVAGGVGIVTD